MSKFEIPSADFELNLTPGNVKAAMKLAEASSSDLWKVHPSMLRRIPGFNGRIRTPAYLEHLADIKNSIRENGYFSDKPLAGYVAKDEATGEDVIFVTEGHTRFDAVEELIAEGLEFATVPIVIKPKGTTMEDLTVALVTSNDGRPFTTYETALMVKRLQGMGMDEATIARRLGFKSGKDYVDSLLLLAGAPKAIRDLLIADKITATMAIHEMKSSGGKAPERLKAAVETAAAKGKAKASPKHLEKKAPKAAGKTKKAAPTPVSISFDAAWSEKAAAGYQYGEDALENVKLGWDMAVAKVLPTAIEATPSINAEDVLADADVCGILWLDNDGGSHRLLQFAATLLARVGAEVYDKATEPAPEEDPAEGL